MTPSLPENQPSAPQTLSCLDVPSGAVVRWLLPDGTTKLASLQQVASEAGYLPPAWPERIETRLVDSYKRSFLTAPWNNCRHKNHRHLQESAFASKFDFGAPQADSLARGANATPLSLHRGLGGPNLHNHKDFGINASQSTKNNNSNNSNNNNMFAFSRSQKVEKASGFSGVGNNASLSFAIARDPTASASPVRGSVTLEGYPTYHGGVPLPPLTSTSMLGEARILGETVSAKYKSLCRSKDDENNEPHGVVPDKLQSDDVVQDAIFTVGTVQNSAIFSTTVIHDNTSASTPPKTISKLKSVTIELRELCEESEVVEKSVEHRFPTAEDICHDMAEAVTEWPDRPVTPRGGDEYQRNLYAEPCMEKYRFFGDDIRAMLIDLNVPCYNEADYESPGTPETPGKGVNEEWEHRTRFGNLQPTNFWTAPLGAAMEWKVKVGVDASGWDIYSDDLPAMDVQGADFVALGGRASAAPKGKTKIGLHTEGWDIYAVPKESTVNKAKTKDREAGITCGRVNHALYKSKPMAHTSKWSHLPAQAGSTSSNAALRDTISPGWFPHLEGGPESRKIAVDTSAPGVKGAGGVVKIAHIPVVETGPLVEEDVDKFSEESADAVAVGDAAAAAAAAKLAEEKMKASKKRILMLMKEQKERDRKKAEEEAKKAAEELRKLEEELAAL